MSTISQARTYINYLTRVNDDNSIAVKEQLALQLLLDVNEEKERE